MVLLYILEKSEMLIGGERGGVSGSVCKLVITCFFTMIFVMKLRFDLVDRIGKKERKCTFCCLILVIECEDRL